MSRNGAFTPDRKLERRENQEHVKIVEEYKKRLLSPSLSEPQKRQILEEIDEKFRKKFPKEYDLVSHHQFRVAVDLRSARTKPSRRDPTLSCGDSDNDCGA